VHIVGFSSNTSDMHGMNINTGKTFFGVPGMVGRVI
jgi:hypothetical protein